MSATNRGGERKAYDFYATPPETIRSFLANFDGISSSDRILEPSAGNGQIIAVSEGYKAMASCMNGIESVKKNAVDAKIAEEE